MSTPDGTNGRRGPSWTTLFAGIGLFLTIGSIVVYALIGQWSVQFSAIHQKIASERELTDLKLKNHQTQFQLEVANAKQESMKHTGK